MSGFLLRAAVQTQTERQYMIAVREFVAWCQQHGVTEAFDGRTLDWQLLEYFEEVYQNTKAGDGSTASTFAKAFGSCSRTCASRSPAAPFKAGSDWRLRRSPLRCRTGSASSSLKR